MFLTAAAAACGGSPNAPAPALALSCPVRAEGSTTGSTGVAVTFQVTVQGGRLPAPVVCTPPSGSTFPIGITTVSCSVTDADDRNAGCSFPVAVTRTATLAFTRFLAFGDSITEGVVSPAPNLLALMGLPDAYPGQLQQMLAERYTGQTITVINRGIGGERLAEGRERLSGVLDEDGPEVLLLLEGVNNIRNVPTMELAGDLDEMVREARRRGLEVLIATLLPVSEDREASRPGTQEAIEELNEEILGIARKNSLAEPVDLFALFSSMPSLLGMDGLHPTAAGYSRIAEAFFERIRNEYEVEPPAETAAIGLDRLSSGSAERSSSRPLPAVPAASPFPPRSRSPSSPRTRPDVPGALRR